MTSLCLTSSLPGERGKAKYGFSSIPSRNGLVSILSRLDFDFDLDFELWLGLDFVPKLGRCSVSILTS